MKNTSWNLLPNTSVNGIMFGTDRLTVRKILGKPKRIFKKTADAANTTDAYDGFHVYYSAEDKLEAIELFDSEKKLSINSQQIFPGTLKEARKILPDLVGDNNSYSSKECSVGICTEEEGIISVLVGHKDYYK